VSGHRLLNEPPRPFSALPSDDDSRVVFVHISAVEKAGIGSLNKRQKGFFRRQKWIDTAFRKLLPKCYVSVVPRPWQHDRQVVYANKAEQKS
jgi:hypothetical protein